MDQKKARDWYEQARLLEQLGNRQVSNQDEAMRKLQFCSVLAAVETAENLGRIAESLDVIQRLLADRSLERPPERRGDGNGSICPYPEAG